MAAEAAAAARVREEIAVTTHEVMEWAEIVSKIRLRIIGQLIVCLTTLKIEEDLEPYNSDQILEFIATHEDGIARAMTEIVREWDNEDLEDPEDEWIREVLYIHVQFC
jgi:hypothetical protein